MQSNNPAFRGGAWSRGQRFATFRDASPAELQRQYDAPAYLPVHERTMTIDAVVLRTAALLGTAALTGALTWIGLGQRGPSLILPAALVGLALAMVIIFKQVTHPAPILAYAAVEGVVLGGVSWVFEAAYPGIVTQAVIGTAGVFGGMLLAYRMGWLRATPKFARWVTGALIGVLVLMIVDLAVAAFGSGSGLGLRSGGPLSIVFSLVVIGVAALTFILDFDAIERGIGAGAPERYAWYAAFGLVVGLVWLYLEILRLLGYLRSSS